MDDDHEVRCEGNRQRHFSRGLSNGVHKINLHGAGAGVHNAKAEECTTPRIGSRNIEINIGGGGLPRNQK